ncbi:MAG: NlpC/P60 family protein [Beijerinckiaceae bacterium]|nr:NlpC/P60 family protein [Beijerinckiaceae bacterium]
MSPRRDVVDVARGWIGTPYQHQASLKAVGCDCLGLLRGIWRERFGSEPEVVPPYAPDWAESLDRAAASREPLIAAAMRHLSPVEAGAMQPGDVLIFRWRSHLPAKHLAILSAPDLMIHAHDGASVCEVAFSPWWQRHLAAVFRFPEISP